MSITRNFTNLSACLSQIRKDFRARDRRLHTAVRKAARDTARYVVQQTVPVAFAELQKSIKTVEVKPGTVDVRADARHAAGVERGTGPHWVPLAPLLAWVKLRGMQGLSKTGRVSKSQHWRMAPAIRVAQSLRGYETGTTRRQNRATPVDAATAVAQAIRGAIAKRGTKPFWYMRQAVPWAQFYLEQAVNAALPDRDSQDS